MEINEKMYGPDHPNVAMGANNLATILYAQRDPAGASRHTERALRIWQATLGPEHPLTKKAAHNLALIKEELAKAPGD